MDSLALSKTGGGVAQGPSLEESARAELKTLRGLEAGTLTADLSCESVHKWWKRWERSYPLLARAARVLFGAPASAAVLEPAADQRGQRAASSSKFGPMDLTEEEDEENEASQGDSGCSQGRGRHGRGLGTGCGCKCSCVPDRTFGLFFWDGN